MKRPDHAIDAYLEGELTAEEARMLEAWINAEPANAAAFLHLIQTHQMLGSIGREEQLARQASKITPQQIDPLTLASLARMEASADAITLPPETPADNHHERSDDDAGSLSAHDLAAAGSYMIRHALTSKPARWAYAAAAVLFIGALLIPWDNNEPPADTRLAQDNTPADSAQPIAPDQPVATLTASHNALWAEGALAPSSDLQSGQKLTLTQGFAEITTARGAIAILEAPATIQLINNNALHLHAGKLVGICETDSSKGFLVRTPHADISDLGTRFGVDASLSDATEVHVFEGEVAVAMSSSDILETKQTHLTAGQAVRAESAAERLVAIDQDRARFAALAEDGGLVLPLGASVHGIAALSGAAAWSPGSTYIGTDFEQWPQHDKVIVFEELSAHRLTSQVPVTLRTPGSTTDLETTSPATVIPAGTTVRSYILLLNPQTSGRYSGSVTFDGEVIGIATDGDQDRALADQATGLVKFTTSYPWIEGEEVTLHNNRQTVSFVWNASSGTTTDAVRVFVRVPAGDQP